MTQPINTFQDILDALDQNPEIRREFNKRMIGIIRSDPELRRELLSEELLELPVRFTRLEADMTEVKADITGLKEGQARLEADMTEVKADVSSLKEGQARLEADMTEVKADVSSLKEGQARLEADVTGLKEGQARMSCQIAQMSGTLDNLAGHSYENKAVRWARRAIRRRLNAHSAGIIYCEDDDSGDLESNILLPAINEGRITRRQVDQLEHTDAILQCADRAGNITQYAAVEISITVQDRDRRRAARRAQLLSAATGEPAHPFVVGGNEEPPGPGVPEAAFLQYGEDEE